MHVQFFEQDELLAELDYEPSLNKVSNYVCYTTKPLSKPFGDFTPDGNLLMDFFEWRCWDRRRPDIDHILHFIGLHDYDPLTVVLKTHGLKHCDYLWLKFDTDPEDLTYDKIKIRD